MTENTEWMLLLVQIPSEPSRHRVAVWRQLRRTGAVPVASGLWALPESPVFGPGLDRAEELCRAGDGTLAIFDARARDEQSEAVIRQVFTTARIDEWSEFTADCGKFDEEIAREIAKRKFTFAELEEEEQSLDRLRRWFRDLKKRDVLELPEAVVAEDRLRSCAAALDDYAERVYQAVHATSQTIGQTNGQTIETWSDAIGIDPEEPTR
ncbi:Chromate resistance protein ChrB [Brevibacterium zhoupengii]|uniref:Chromate resistance protein ChrB n=1 Tax=Brevibacterium zhoupengii TaxID=2898795 RepID=UPI001E2D94CC|nr:Chromate resistance protein ChrB [Brevibacterium zhoupengii]